MSDQKAKVSKLFAVLQFAGEIIGVLMQLQLVTLGYELVWGDGLGNEVLTLVAWCIIASTYLFFTILMLNFSARSSRPESSLVRGFTSHPIIRAVSNLTTFAASVLGIFVAIDLITSLGREIHDPLQEASALWAMLLSWAMYHWGFARIYYSRYHRGGSHQLKFPGTPDPSIVDFVYFAFTNATAFSVSDVQVRGSRMRWTVVWHTTTAFFFNALIIALSMNVISSGKLFARLFDAL